MCKAVIFVSLVLVFVPLMQTVSAADLPKYAVGSSGIELSIERFVEVVGTCIIASNSEERIIIDIIAEAKKCLS